MARPLVAGDVLEVVYKQTLFQQTLLSVFHYRVSTEPSGLTAEQQCQELADQLFSVPADCPLLAKMLAAGGTNWGIDYVTVQLIKPIRAVYGKSIIGMFGTYAGTCITANVAASIEKRTGTIGRKGIGRLQFGGVPQEAMNDGGVDSGYLTLELAELATEIATGLAGPMGVGGQYKPCLPASTGTSGDYDLYDAIPQDTLRTMHRRTLRVGI